MGKEIIYSPLKGELLKLEDIDDSVFSSKMMGEGLGFIPKEGKVYAPVDGVIASFFPTGHAIGIKADSGIELLIHVGLDTVELDGEGFTKHAKQGKRVKKGDLLLSFDIDFIKSNGYSIQTAVIMTNLEKDQQIKVSDEKELSFLDELITVFTGV